MSADNIVELSGIETMTKVQTAIAAKVLRVANNQGQAALQLLDAAMQNSQDAIQNMAEALTVDTYA